MWLTVTLFWGDKQSALLDLSFVFVWEKGGGKEKAGEGIWGILVNE